MMKLVSVESVFPNNYIEQQDLIEFIKERQRPWSSPSELARIEKVQSRIGVRGRHYALPLHAYNDLADVRAKQTQSITIAADLGSRATAKSLNAAGLRPDDVDHLFFASSSVISCPPVDARIVDQLAMRRDVKRSPLLGMGCVGSIVGLQRAADYLRGLDDGVAAVCAVELISFLLRWEDCSMNAQSSIGLFGDASAAAIVVGPNHPLARSGNAPGPDIVASRSALLRGSFDWVRTDTDAQGSFVTMAYDISERIGATIRGELAAFLAEHQLTFDDIGSWVCHPGGPQTVQKLIETLRLPAATAALMYDTLQTYGNISSANILVLLQTVIRTQRPAPGTMGIMLSYGPGFGFEFILLRW